MNQTRLTQRLISIFSGVGMGTFLGALIGLYANNTIVAGLALLTFLVLIILGCQDKANQDLYSLRMGAFGVVFLAVCSITIYINENRVQSFVQVETLKLVKDSLITKDEAKRIILLKKFNIHPKLIIIPSLKQAASSPSKN